MMNLFLCPQNQIITPMVCTVYGRGPSYNLKNTSVAPKPYF